jgi:hypothetical protein
MKRAKKSGTAAGVGRSGRTGCSAPRRVTWDQNMGEAVGLPVTIQIGGQSRLVSRRLAEQIRDELIEVLEQNPLQSASAAKRR